MQEIILCDLCEGKGTRDFKILDDYHKGEYHYEFKECHKCKGSGRLTKKTTIEFKPYIPSKL